MSRKYRDVRKTLKRARPMSDDEELVFRLAIREQAFKETERAVKGPTGQERRKLGAPRSRVKSK
jgi:hypothetical protein